MPGPIENNANKNKMLTQGFSPCNCEHPCVDDLFHAFCMVGKQGDQSNALINQIVKSADRIDWNKAPTADLDPIRAGITCAWLAAHLALTCTTDALLNLLLNLPPDQFINFNAAPLNAISNNRGITLAMLALVLADKNKPDLLNKILSLPMDQFTRINFNAAPLIDDHSSQGVTIAMLAVDLARLNKPYLLNKILNLPPKQFASLDLDFNATALAANHLSQGVTLAMLAVDLAIEAKPGLLVKISSLPMNQFARINFNAAPLGEKHPRRGLTLLSQLIAPGSRAGTFLPRTQALQFHLRKILQLPKDKFTALILGKKDSDTESDRVNNAFFHFKEFLLSPSEASYKTVVDAIDVIDALIDGNRWQIYADDKRATKDMFLYALASYIPDLPDNQYHLYKRISGYSRFYSEARLFMANLRAFHVETISEEEKSKNQQKILIYALQARALARDVKRVTEYRTLYSLKMFYPNESIHTGMKLPPKGSEILDKFEAKVLEIQKSDFVASPHYFLPQVGLYKYQVQKAARKLTIAAYEYRERESKKTRDSSPTRKPA